VSRLTPPALLPSRHSCPPARLHPRHAPAAQKSIMHLSPLGSISSSSCCRNRERRRRQLRRLEDRLLHPHRVLPQRLHHPVPRRSSLTSKAITVTSRGQSKVQGPSPKSDGRPRSLRWTASGPSKSKAQVRGLTIGPRGRAGFGASEYALATSPRSAQAWADSAPPAHDVPRELAHLLLDHLPVGQALVARRIQDVGPNAPLEQLQNQRNAGRLKRTGSPSPSPRSRPA